MADVLEPEEGLDFASLVTIAVDLVPYVLQWPAASETDGVAEALTLVVAKRNGGMLLALPLNFIPDAVLRRANIGQAGGPVGVSTVVNVPGVLLDGGVRAYTGTTMDVLLVDFTEDMAQNLRSAESLEEIAMPFDPDSSFTFPAPKETLDVAMEWVRGSDEEAGLAFYSAQDQGLEEDLGETEDSAELHPQFQKPKRSKKPTPKGAGPTGSGGDQKPKRVTTASLAASLEQIMDLVPNLTSQLQTLSQRQELLESRLTAPTRAGALGLSQPLSSSLPPRVVSPGMVAQTIAVPPPRTQEKAPSGLVSGLDFQPSELKELEEEKVPPQAENHFAQAILAQSQALTALVGQIANASQDPLVDLGSSASSTSTRGAAGRARLQAELATHSGAFFTSVLRAMARRMQPTVASSGSPAELLQRGVCGTQYMERYGGFGRHRDLGLVMFQVMTVMDYMQSENYGAARDSLALLAVCLDQAVLDGGRFDLAALLTLQEDPPSSIFINRQTSTLSRARAFSQLADQKWITVALAFIKELDTIQTKRQELSSASSGPSAKTQASQEGHPKAKSHPKKKAKGGGKGNQQAVEQEEE
eukprot:s1713_g3.t1